MSNKIYSTGVLRRGENTITAVAEVLNLSSKKPIHVRVEMLNWSNYDFAIPLPVKIGEELAVWPFELASNHLAEFYTDLVENDAVLYEIRVIISTNNKNNEIVINCFGNSAFPYTSQEGNTVLFNDLAIVLKHE